MHKKDKQTNMTRSSSDKGTFKKYSYTLRMLQPIWIDNTQDMQK